MGLRVHEDGVGTFVPAAMGWSLDLDYRPAPGKPPCPWTMVMICCDDKLQYYRQRFTDWAECDRLSRRDLDSAAGTALFLSAAFPAGAAYVAALYAASTSSIRTRRMPVSRQVQDSLNFFAIMLADWDGVGPILASFGPSAGAEVEGWVDAATVDGHGCGGVCYVPSTHTLLGFFHPWSEKERMTSMAVDRESTTVLECFAITVWLRTFGAAHCSNRRTLLRTDSESAMQAHSKASSSRECIADSMFEARLLAGMNFITLRVRQVRTIPVPFSFGWDIYRVTQSTGQSMSVLVFTRVPSTPTAVRDRAWPIHQSPCCGRCTAPWIQSVV